MIIFTITQPLEVPLKKGEIDLDEIRNSFWRKSHGLGEEAGCYIFTVPRKRGAQGCVPIYVGKSARPFREECFNPEKLLKLGNYLRHHPAGCLKLFLLVHPPNRGGVNHQAIGELETKLIKMAFKVHPRLINLQNARAEAWGVRGLLPDGRGKRSRGAIELRAVLGLDGGEELAGPEGISKQASGLEPEVGGKNRQVVSLAEQQPLRIGLDTGVPTDKPVL
jgi:hypothetical protein